MIENDAKPPKRLTLSLEGETFTGTAEEVVQAMTSSSSFRCHESPEEYMRGYVRRNAILGTNPLSADSPEAFIESLVLAGLAIRGPFG